MAFVISKKSKKRNRDITLYYLVENYRKDKKIKRRTILALGENTSVSGFLDTLDSKKRELETEVEKYDYDIRNKRFHPLGGWPWQQVRRMQLWSDEAKAKIAKLEIARNKALEIFEKYPSK